MLQRQLPIADPLRVKAQMVDRQHPRIADAQTVGPDTMSPLAHVILGMSNNKQRVKTRFGSFY